MSTMRGLRRGAMWGCAGLTALLLLGWALAPWGDIAVAPGHTLALVEGSLTLRVWPAGPRAEQGALDAAERGLAIPDTWNIPLLMLLALLAVPAVALWWWDRAAGARAAAQRGRTATRVRS